MKLLALMCFLFISSSAQANNIKLTPYLAVSEKQILSDSRSIADSMVTNFALANKVNIAKFRYKEFDKGLSQMHPVVAWAVLRYLAERSTGARKQHVHNYLGKSQVIKTLNAAFAKHPESADAIQFFEAQAPKGGFSKTKEKDFLKLIDKTIVVLTSKKV